MMRDSRLYDEEAKRVAGAYRGLTKLNPQHELLKFLALPTDSEFKGIKYDLEYKDEFEEKFGGQGISHITILGNYREALKEATLEEMAP